MFFAFNERAERLLGDEYSKIIPFNFNEKGQTAFIKIKKGETKKESSLIFSDPKLGQSSFKLPSYFKKSSFDSHGIDNRGRLLASYKEEPFIWDENNGVQWLKDLIIKDNRFDFDDIDSMVLSQDGTIMVEVESLEDDETHAVLLIPGE